MCEIVGFLRPRFESDWSPAITLSMLAMIGHRGPDEQGYYFDDAVALGSTRLAVIDQPGGKQ